MRSACEALRSVDRTMARLIDRHGAPRFGASRHAGGAFPALARAICHQQLAGAAAAAIHGRFEALFDGPITPAAALALPEPSLRAAGLSASKAGSIRDLAAKAVDGTIPLDALARLPDDEIVRRLVLVRGVGPWTAEMFLIFQLRRLDVWPVLDYGVRKGYARAYRRRELPDGRELARLGEKYRPFRSVAAWYLWREADG
ncbi:MAG: DNA-3-methyladenine glycosylase family protein [Planctomycetota bacterium JB042]